MIDLIVPVPFKPVKIRSEKIGNDREDVDEILASNTKSPDGELGC